MGSAGPEHKVRSHGARVAPAFIFQVGLHYTQLGDNVNRSSIYTWADMAKEFEEKRMEQTVTYLGETIKDRPPTSVGGL